MMTSIPTFFTDRLVLREIRLSDALSYERNFVDYDVVSELAAAVPWPYPAGGVADYIQNQILPQLGVSKWYWVLALKTKPDEVIGGIELWRQERPENRGFWLGKAYWGHGYMTEAVTPITEYAFSSLGFEKLTFSNALGNLRSRRIKEKTGARFIGTRPAKFVNPKYSEAEIWELTKETWLKIYRDLAGTPTQFGRKI